MCVRAGTSQPHRPWSHLRWKSFDTIHLLRYIRERISFLLLPFVLLFLVFCFVFALRCFALFCFCAVASFFLCVPAVARRRRRRRGAVLPCGWGHGSVGMLTCWQRTGPDEQVCPGNSTDSCMRGYGPGVWWCVPGVSCQEMSKTRPKRTRMMWIQPGSQTVDRSVTLWVARRSAILGCRPTATKATAAHHFRLPCALHINPPRCAMAHHTRAEEAARPGEVALSRAAWGHVAARCEREKGGRTELHNR